MAELADALDLGSSEATRTGSIPATRTIKNILSPKKFAYSGKLKWRIFIYFYIF